MSYSSPLADSTTLSVDSLPGPSGRDMAWSQTIGSLKFAFGLSFVVARAWGLEASRLVATVYYLPTSSFRRVALLRLPLSSDTIFP